MVALDRLGAAGAERWGRLDLLVGNAGELGPITPVSHIVPEALKRHWLSMSLPMRALRRAMEPAIAGRSLARSFRNPARRSAPLGGLMPPRKPPLMLW